MIWIVWMLKLKKIRTVRVLFKGEVSEKTFGLRYGDLITEIGHPCGIEVNLSQATLLGSGVNYLIGLAFLSRFSKKVIVRGANSYSLKKIHERGAKDFLSWKLLNFII